MLQFSICSCSRSARASASCDPRAHVLSLRFLLRELQLGSLTIARMGLPDQHVGLPARQRELLFGLLELVGRTPQLFAGDEAFLEERLELVVLLSQALDLLLGELEPGSRLVDGQRPFALRERGDGGLPFLPVQLRDLQIDAAPAGSPAPCAPARARDRSCRAARGGRPR